MKLTPREIAQKILPSVVLVIIETNSPDKIKYGSGFFVKEDVIATNYHLIDGARRGVAKIVGEHDKAYGILGIVGMDKKNDLALLKLKDVKGKPLSLNRDDSLGIGDEVFAVGNPKGLEGTFSQGIVSSLRKEGDVSLIQITAPISPGSSGGALLNDRGDVVGVTIGAIANGQSLNFAVPVSRLRPLVQHQGTLLAFFSTATEPQKTGPSASVAADPRTVYPSKSIVSSKYKLPYRTPDVVENGLKGVVKSITLSSYEPQLRFGKWEAGLRTVAETRVFNEDGYLDLIISHMPTLEYTPPDSKYTPPDSPSRRPPSIPDFQSIPTCVSDFEEFDDDRQVSWIGGATRKVVYKYSYSANMVEINSFNKCKSCSDFELDETTFTIYEKGETIVLGPKGELRKKLAVQDADGVRTRILYDSEGKLACKSIQNRNGFTEIWDEKGVLVEKSKSYKLGPVEVVETWTLSWKNEFGLEKRTRVLSSLGVEITIVNFRKGKETDRRTVILDKATGLTVLRISGKTKHKYTYEFDSSGNWIKSTKWKEVTRFGRTYFEPTLIEEREITYY